jgi:HEAT repeat protein
MASLGDPREDSLLTELLRNAEPGLRLTAARALREDGAQGNAVRVLVSALSDTCHGDRWRAARALRDLRDDRALPGLVHQLVVDEHAAVRSMAANAIATSGVSRGAALLRSALAGAPTAEFARVARAIDTLGDSPAYERLLAALRDARRAQSRRPRAG